MIGLGSDNRYNTQQPTTLILKLKLFTAIILFLPVCCSLYEKPRFNNAKNAKERKTFRRVSKVWAQVPSVKAEAIKEYLRKERCLQKINAAM